MSRRDRDLHDDRLTLGAAGVMALTDAARLLPGNEAVNREWLRARGLVVNGPSGAALVIWGDVLDALRPPRRKGRSSQEPEPSGPMPPEGRVPLGGRR